MNNAVLTVTRLKKIFGFAIKITVIVDDEEIGKLSPGNSVTKELTPGIHKVYLKTAETVVGEELNITETTKSVEVTCKIKMGLLVGAPKLVEVKYN